MKCMLHIIQVKYLSTLGLVLFTRAHARACAHTHTHNDGVGVSRAKPWKALLTALVFKGQQDSCVHINR